MAALAVIGSTGCLGRVAEWQTRWLQVPVSFGTWGFKSPFAHQIDRRPAAVLADVCLARDRAAMVIDDADIVTVLAGVAALVMAAGMGYYMGRRQAVAPPTRKHERVASRWAGCRSIFW